MTEVVDMWKGEEKEGERVRAFVFYPAGFVERRYAELKVGDIFFSRDADGARIHPIFRDPDETAFAVVRKEPFRAVAQKAPGWCVVVDVGLFEDLLGERAANNPRPEAL